MTWTLKVRGAHSQPMTQDFLCDDCGPFYATTDRDATEAPCPDCGKPGQWVISMPKSVSVAASVVRGPVARPESKMFLDTRELGEGMPMSEWKEKRRKLYQERRWKEHKNGG